MSHITTVRCIYVICFTMLLFYDKCNGTADDSVYQEAAKAVYINPQYVTNMNIFTFRHTRRSPYLTSANGTILHNWENNVSVVVDAFNAKTKQGILSLELKVCDIISKITWAKEWLKQYSNVPLQCPVRANTYFFKEVELPPKSFPILLPAGEYQLEVNFLTTKTRERILDLKIMLKFKKGYGF